MTHLLKGPRLWWSGLAVALVALVGVACAPASPAPQPSPAPHATAVAAPSAAPATAAATSAPGGSVELQAGVDAEGNFYRGDPNAPVRLVEYSDFQ